LIQDVELSRQQSREGESPLLSEMMNVRTATGLRYSMKPKGDYTDISHVKLT